MASNGRRAVVPRYSTCKVEAHGGRLQAAELPYAAHEGRGLEALDIAHELEPDTHLW